jgi:hypothetical protein
MGYERFHTTERLQQRLERRFLNCAITDRRTVR